MRPPHLSYPNLKHTSTLNHQLINYFYFYFFFNSTISGDVAGAEQQMVQVNTERERCRVDLRDNLLKRQAELEASLSSLLGTGAGTSVEEEEEEEGGHEETKSSRGGKKGSKKKTAPKCTAPSSSSSSSSTEISDQVVLQEAETHCEMELERVSQGVREQESEVISMKYDVLLSIYYVFFE